MTYAQVVKAQKEHGVWDMQKLINSGDAWRMEGYVGRTAMSMLESGACMLPKKAFRDYYGNIVPSRDVLKSGTKGTFQNSVNYYQSL